MREGRSVSVGTSISMPFGKRMRMLGDLGGEESKGGVWILIGTKPCWVCLACLRYLLAQALRVLVGIPVRREGKVAGPNSYLEDFQEFHARKNTRKPLAWSSFRVHPGRSLSLVRLTASASPAARSAVRCMPLLGNHSRA